MHMIGMGGQKNDTLASRMASANNHHIKAYAWVFRLPIHPIVLTGTRRIDGIRDALQGVEIQLRRDEWFSILEAARGRPVD